MVPDVKYSSSGSSARVSPSGANSAEDLVKSSYAIQPAGALPASLPTAAAIANAIYHATGKRIHETPITIDKILAPEVVG